MNPLGQVLKVSEPGTVVLAQNNRIPHHPVYDTVFIFSTRGASSISFFSGLRHVRPALGACGLGSNPVRHLKGRVIE